MISIPFWTILVLGPIPVVHIFLHLFLRFWKKYPAGFYLMGVAVWAMFVPLAKYSADWPLVFFSPPQWLKIICGVTAWCSLFLVVWSVQTLTPKRFFLWAVVRPETVRHEQILFGPYKFLSHPAYTAYIMIFFAAFLATGFAALFIFSVINCLLMMAVIGLENHELQKRLRG